MQTFGERTLDVLRGGARRLARPAPMLRARAFGSIEATSMRVPDGADAELLQLPGVGAKMLARVRASLEAHDASHLRIEATAFALGLGLSREQARFLQRA